MALTPRLCILLSVVLTAGPASAAGFQADPSAALKNARAGRTPAELRPADVSPAFLTGDAVLSSFKAPDGTNAYACTFHWFRTREGRLVGLDLIRSDDSGKLALRAYMEGVDGKLYGIIHETESSSWAPFSNGTRPDLRSEQNVLGRGENWIAGAVRGGARQFSSRAVPEAPKRGGGVAATDVVFELEVLPVSKGYGTGRLGLAFVDLVASDFPRVRYKGYIEFYGVRHEIDSDGIASIHYGRKLPEAAYVATVPSGEGPGILLAAASGDNMRLAGRLLRGRSFIYSYGTGGVDSLSFGVGTFAKDIPLGGGAKLVVSELSRFEHSLLGVYTVTGTASAKIVRRGGEETDLGTVIFDYRGATYTGALDSGDSE